MNRRTLLDTVLYDWHSSVPFLWTLLKCGCSFRRKPQPTRELLNTGACWVLLLPLLGRKGYLLCGMALSRDYIASAFMEAWESGFMGRWVQNGSLQLIWLSRSSKELIFFPSSENFLLNRSNLFWVAVTQLMTLLYSRKYLLPSWPVNWTCSFHRASMQSFSSFIIHKRGHCIWTQDVLFTFLSS